MSSFYGGQPGQSFILRKTYASIEDMTDDWGSDDVWYGDYIIIDTENKNHSDNGKIYRKIEDSTIKWEYIAQIVGPTSGMPYAAATSESNILTVITSIVSSGTTASYYYKNSNGTTVISDDPPEETSNLYQEKLTVATTGGGGGLVPGAEISGTEITYNDNITWKWCSVRQKDNQSTSALCLGFSMPYPVFTLSGALGTGYDSEGKYSPSASIEETSASINHPFYWAYDMKLPRGIRGEYISEIQHASYESLKSNDIYLPSAFSIATEDSTTAGTYIGQLIVDNDKKFIPTFDETSQTYTYNEAQYKKEFEISYYILKDYSHKLSGNSYYVFAGVYDVIEGITWDEESVGNFTITKTASLDGTLSGRAYSGILVGMQLTKEKLSGLTVKNYLDTTYPYGLGRKWDEEEQKVIDSDKSLIGKIVVYIGSDAEKRANITINPDGDYVISKDDCAKAEEYYAFDYVNSTTKWFRLSLTAENNQDINNSESNIALLREGGMTIVSAVVNATTTLPKYWK